MTQVALIGLGTNENREYNMLLGLARIMEAFRVTRVSSVFETAPVGTWASIDNYYNSCVMVDLESDPGDLRERLRAIEADMGRVRTRATVYRPLDLDLLAVGPSVEQLDWMANDAMAAFIAPLEELGIVPAAPPYGDARPVCVWRRSNVVVDPGW